MTKKLLLVDYENLHESYSAIIFVGTKQNPPKAARKPATAHRFQRVDFHIAFQLGRTIETVPETECFVLSKEGYDPLLAYINKCGLKCQRLER